MRRSTPSPSPRRQDGADPVRAGQVANPTRALDAGYAAMHAEHAAWWREFWAESSVFVPEPHILRHYYLVRYFYGAASRRGAPPMPLQGVWTADSGGLPPWKGDYHNDLNTQMTYMGYQAAGHFDEGACYLDFLWDRLPRFRRFAREFYGTDGAAAPGVMTLAGEPLAGWVQYSLSPTMSAWSAPPVLPALALHDGRRVPARAGLSVVPRGRRLHGAAARARRQTASSSCRCLPRRRSSTTRSGPG